MHTVPIGRMLNLPVLLIPLRAHVQLLHLLNACYAVKGRVHLNIAQVSVADFAAAELFRNFHSWNFVVAVHV